MRASPVAPIIRNKAGRTNVRKVTKAETGFPGSPKIRQRSRLPNKKGLPGFTATRQRSISAPISRNASRTRSCSPTETPPLMTRASCCTASRNVVQRVSKLSGQCLCIVTCAPVLAASASSITPLLSKISPTRGCFLGPASSSPVVTIATRARVPTLTDSIPCEASKPSLAGSSRSPRFKICCPIARSAPALRTKSPSGICAARIKTKSPSRSVSSCITTASAPVGMGAPVKIRTASDAESDRFFEGPAGCSPTIFNRAFLPADPATTA